ncbi:MAG: fumarylacetoacetate hydrolase family protein, partial [Acetobacteraceae bacterium]
MATDLSATWDVRLKSWVASANGHPDFPIQNLPFGVFSPAGGSPRGGVAIGDEILDLAAALEAGLLAGDGALAAAAAAGPELNAFLALGAGPRAALRVRLSRLLSADGGDDAKRMQSRQRLLHHAADCALHLPARIGDYTDFYAGIQHAMNVGRLFRPANPLLPNYKYVPIGYHGRASSILPSGTPFRRPNGQRKPASETVPTFGPCRNLDYELEIGIWIGPGNALGEPIPISRAAHHIGGFCLFNDWSARDLQAWEYQPLGPFLAKSFASTISPW